MFFCIIINPITLKSSAENGVERFVGTGRLFHIINYILKLILNRLTEAELVIIMDKLYESWEKSPSILLVKKKSFSFLQISQELSRQVNWRLFRKELKAMKRTWGFWELFTIILRGKRASSAFTRSQKSHLLFLSTCRGVFFHLHTSFLYSYLAEKPFNSFSV